jgi:mono/diheme cytochrome c family protein
MNRIVTTAFATAAFAALTGTAAAQELGDVRGGRHLAETVCVECHAIDKGAPRSPNGNAPTFQTVATTPGMTAMALRVALRTSHKEMPNLVLTNQQIDDVIAYIATLK